MIGVGQKHCTAKQNCSQCKGNKIKKESREGKIHKFSPGEGGGLILRGSPGFQRERRGSQSSPKSIRGRL